MQTPIIQSQRDAADAGATHSMYKPSVYQNSLQAVAFPQHLSGYKNPLDPSHKNDKSSYIRYATPKSLTSQQQTTSGTFQHCSCAGLAVHQSECLTLPLLLCCSSYKGNFGPVDDKPVKFRDGMPIDARRVPGKPLMVLSLYHTLYAQCKYTRRSRNRLQLAAHGSVCWFFFIVRCCYFVFATFRRPNRPTQRS